MSILEKLTNQMQGTIESGVSLALHNKNQEVDPIHLMWALLTNSGSILHQALNKMNVDKAAIELETKSIANKLPTVSTVTKENLSDQFERLPNGRINFKNLPGELIEVKGVIVKEK